MLHPRSVSFAPLPHKPPSIPTSISNPMPHIMGNSRKFNTYNGTNITDKMLSDCARLFNNNYGIWGERASEFIPSAKEGARIRMSVPRLREQCLHDIHNCSLTICLVGEGIVGHAFATRWDVPSHGTICWITQLVVDKDYRGLNIASNILAVLKDEGDSVFGLVSSHPAACMALSKQLGGATIDSIDLNFIRVNAETILETTPVQYLKGAELHGSLFGVVTDNTISSVNTEFFVDHHEPLEALDWVRENVNWPLGDLLDGYEFFLIVRSRPNFRERSRSRSVSSHGLRHSDRRSSSLIDEEQTTED